MKGKGRQGKGKAGEREACRVLEELWGRPWRRSASQAQQRRDGLTEPDIVLERPRNAWDAAQGPEVKRSESESGWGALEQAFEDARDTDRVPWVMMRRNRRPWVALMRIEDLPAVVEVVTGCPVEPCPFVRHSHSFGKRPSIWRALGVAERYGRKWSRVSRDGWPLVIVCDLRSLVSVAEELGCVVHWGEVSGCETPKNNEGGLHEGSSDDCADGNRLPKPQLCAHV